MPVGGICGPCQPTGAAGPNRASSISDVLGSQVRASVVLPSAVALVGLGRVGPGTDGGSPSGPAHGGRHSTGSLRRNANSARSRRVITSRASASPKVSSPPARAALSPSGRATRAPSGMPLMGSLRVLRPTERAARFAAHFAPWANAIAERHWSREAASARAASRSVFRPRSASFASTLARPRPARRRVPPAGFRPVGSWPGGLWPGGGGLHGVVACSLSKATCDGCFGAFNSGGPSSNRAAISGGKYARNRVAVHNTRPRTTTART
jgi:hypothetical protein